MRKNLTVNDRVITTRKLESLSRCMEIGTKATIIGISDRGYDIVDDEGNRMCEIGWASVKPLKNEVLDFNPNQTINEIITWIQDWFNENGSKANAVIGISGGKDSTIVAKLLVKALGKERVVGVMMPNGVQSDIDDAKRVIEDLGIRSYNVNINGTFTDLIESIEYNADGSSYFSVSKDARINLAPRIRMATLYAIAQSLENGGRVVNTCNKSEDYVGYSTKYGDSAGDFSPCSDLLVCEMLEIGDALGLPYELVHKVPSDGLCGFSDEDNLGFTYAQLDSYIKWLENGKNGDCPVDDDIRTIIDSKHKANLHKLTLMPAYKKGQH